MPVMKAQHLQRTRATPIVMDLSNIEQEAASIIAQAKAQAAQIMDNARAEADRLRLRVLEEARNAGKAEGFQEGLAQGQKQGHDEAVAQVSVQLQELSSRWAQTLDLLQQHMPAHIADAKTDLVRLALMIARRITHDESLKNRKVAPAIVEEVLRSIAATRRVALHVHPGELPQLETYLPALSATFRGIEEIQLVSDESVSAGGCIARFGAGEIDARVETQLQRVAEELLGDGQAEKP